MFKISRDVYVNEQKVGTMEVIYETDGFTISHFDQETGKAKNLELSLAMATVLYDLMTLAHPTRNSGQSY